MAGIAKIIELVARINIWHMAAVWLSPQKIKPTRQQRHHLSESNKFLIVTLILSTVNAMQNSCVKNERTCPNNC